MLYQRRKLYVQQLALLINCVQKDFSKTGNSHSPKSSLRLERGTDFPIPLLSPFSMTVTENVRNKGFCFEHSSGVHLDECSK